MLAFLFPGQGTLKVGMGQWLRAQPAGAAVFAAATEILGLDVAALCARGPAATLTATRNAQPAVTVCNLAALAVVTGRGLVPDVVAGHSVGELSALYAAGVLDLPSTLRLVRERARLMDSVREPGGMSTAHGLDLATVTELADQCGTPTEPLVVALENGPTAIVVSGALAALERFGLASLAAGAKRVSLLEVSHAFHSPLMRPAVAAWRELLWDTEFRTPSCLVVPNVSATPTSDPQVLRGALLGQLTGRVYWASTLQALDRMGVRDCVEVGDSKALGGFVRASGTQLRCFAATDRIGAALPTPVGTEVLVAGR